MELYLSFRCEVDNSTFADLHRAIGEVLGEFAAICATDIGGGSPMDRKHRDVDLAVTDTASAAQVIDLLGAVVHAANWQGWELIALHRDEVHA